MRMRRMRWWVAGGALGAVLVLAGCGDDDDGGASTAAESGPPVSLEGEVADHGTSDLGDATDLDVELDDQYFAPTFVTAPGGTTVTVRLANEGDLPHTFTIDDLGIDEQVAAGETATVRVTLPDNGTTVFYCRFHIAAGMQGAFVVPDGASGGASPGTTSAVSTPVGGAPGGY